MIETPLAPRLAPLAATDAALPARTAVVVPCYRVRNQILDVLARIGPEVERIYVVDDACPEGTGAYVQASCTDDRVRVIFNPVNLGVGGAVIAGYRAALDDSMQLLVKVDGDGQMDPALIPVLVRPILDGEADYTKGNRFYDLEQISNMPRLRIFGNAVLSFLTKISSGYWDIFDPTNGYTAIHWKVAAHLPFAKISQRFLFETDMLFRLNIMRAVVLDIPMDARYGSEGSNLRVRRVIGGFVIRHATNALKRLFYSYYLRDMSIASLQLPTGLLMLGAGLVYGTAHWIEGLTINTPNPAGTVVLSALLVILGVQFVLSFLAYDIAGVPRTPIHKRLPDRRVAAR